VPLDDFIAVDNDAIVVQELTEDEIVSENLMERNRASGNNVTPEGEEDDDDDETVITVTEAANIARSLRRFVMTRKDVPDRVLESSEILQEFTEKSLLKHAVQKKSRTFLRNKHGKFVSFWFFYMWQTLIPVFLMCFNITKFRYNE
jgi:hypothetical protein